MEGIHYSGWVNGYHRLVKTVDFRETGRLFFLFSKFVIVVDGDIDTRDWKDVIWAISTRVDPVRDFTLVDNTPIDYLDFASPVSGLGSKVGIDATHKWQGETEREWGRPIMMDETVKQRIDAIWDDLDIDT